MLEDIIKKGLQANSRENNVSPLSIIGWIYRARTLFLVVEYDLNQKYSATSSPPQNVATF